MVLLAQIRGYLNTRLHSYCYDDTLQYPICVCSSTSIAPSHTPPILNYSSSACDYTRPIPYCYHHHFSTLDLECASTSKKRSVIVCIVMYCVSIFCLCAMYTVIYYRPTSIRESSSGEEGGGIPNPVHAASQELPHEAPGHAVVEPTQGLNHARGNHSHIRPKQEGHVKSPQGPCIHPFPPKEPGQSCPLSEVMYEVTNHLWTVVVYIRYHTTYVVEGGHHLQGPYVCHEIPCCPLPCLLIRQYPIFKISSYAHIEMFGWSLLRASQGKNMSQSWHQGRRRFPHPISLAYPTHVIVRS